MSSDLARAVATVDLAFDGSACRSTTDARLRECDYGELNGAPVEVVHARRRARVDTPFPGGQSYREVAAGVDALLDELPPPGPAGGCCSSATRRPGSRSTTC